MATQMNQMKKDGKPMGAKVTKTTNAKRQTVKRTNDGKKARAKDKAKKKPTGDAKSATTKSAGKQGAVSRDAKITVIAKSNPRRPGTKVHRRFAFYKTGMTVGEFLKKGGTMGSVRGDLRRGNIRIEGAKS